MSDVTFSNNTPSRIIHVAVGVGNGDGSAANPFHSIQAAVNAATAGTAIVVHAGVYKENVKISDKNSGTSNAPIWLISGDGAQKASIVAADDSKPVIQALGVDNYVIKGFAISGGYDGIQFSQSGRDFSNLVNNIVIQGNVISDVAHDGIKVGQANNVQILDNKISQVASEEGIDLVAVQGAVIARNEVSEVHGQSAAIFAKGGSSNLKIVDNFVHDVSGDGIAAGGNTAASSWRPGTLGYEASNVEISGNKIVSVAKRPVSVRGALNVDVIGNYLEAGERYGNAVYITSGSQDSASPVFSKDVQILNNIVAATTAVLRVDAGNNNAVVQSGNEKGLWSQDVGPDVLSLPSWLGVKVPLPATSAPVTSVTPPPTAVPGAASAPTPTPAPTPAPAPTSVSKPVPPSSVTPAPAASSPSANVGQSAQTGIETTASKAKDSSAWTHVILGTSDKDTLTGTASADRIDGLSREDTMRGGQGDDTYVASGYKDIVIELVNEGTDTIELLDNRYFLPANVENLTAKLSSATLLVGNQLDNKITGGAGADLLIGGGGQDILTGGGGADRFVIGIDDGSDIIKDFQSTDTIVLEGGQFSSAEVLMRSLVQVGHDVQLVIGKGQLLTLEGVDKADLTAAQFMLDSAQAVATLSANSTSAISGTKQAERLEGTAGHDQIDGVGGGDIMIGGAGDDTYAIRDANDVIIEATNGGVDTAKVFIANLALAYGVENAVVQISTGAKIEGNASANRLEGGAGADVLAGAGGKDVLIGGSGKDTFVFAHTGDGADVIADFKRGEDKLDLTGLTKQDPSGTASFVKTASGMDVFFDSAGHHELIAQLTGVSALSASDYIM